MRLQSIMNKALFLYFLRYLMITFLITLSLEKEILIFASEKILDPKICTNPAQAWKIVVVWLKMG